MLSEAKHLLWFEHVDDKQILRFAQNDTREVQCLFQGHNNSSYLSYLIHRRKLLEC